ncbi:unnamed protein product [Soboliphyme baturini]|uniref:C2H2-type domain-containing protein n=1 Tax=Soboliphyme baturini TaxID=241478 RepID=A0A183IG14_9BILA|nr:unnamed protein product [Soboliphyme baturini]
MEGEHLRRKAGEDRKNTKKPQLNRATANVQQASTQYASGLQLLPVTEQPEEKRSCCSQRDIVPERHDDEQSSVLVVLPEGVEDTPYGGTSLNSYRQSAKRKVHRTFMATMDELPIVDRLAMDEHCDLVNKRCLVRKCGRYFNSLAKLAFHLSWSHRFTIGTSSTMRCLVCGQEIATRKLLRSHLQTDHRDIAPHNLAVQVTSPTEEHVY